MAVDTSHLAALRIGLAHERARLAAAKTPQERELRAVWVAQREKEIAAELKFLGLEPEDAAPVDMTDDEILAALKE